MRLGTLISALMLSASACGQTCTIAHAQTYQHAPAATLVTPHQQYSPPPYYPFPLVTVYPLVPPHYGPAYPSEERRAAADELREVRALLVEQSKALVAIGEALKAKGRGRP